MPSHFSHDDSLPPMDCGPPGSSVRGILQARALGGLPRPAPGGLPNPEIELCLLGLQHCRRVLYHQRHLGSLIKNVYIHKIYTQIHWGFAGGSAVKNLPAGQETRVRSLGQEDPLEKEMATSSSVLTWKIARTEESGGPRSMRSQRVGHDCACPHMPHTQYICVCVCVYVCI